MFASINIASRNVLRISSVISNNILRYPKKGQFDILWCIFYYFFFLCYSLVVCYFLSFSLFFQPRKSVFWTIFTILTVSVLFLFFSLYVTVTISVSLSFFLLSLGVCIVACFIFSLTLDRSNLVREDGAVQVLSDFYFFIF